MVLKHSLLHACIALSGFVAAQQDGFVCENNITHPAIWQPKVGTPWQIVLKEKLDLSSPATPEVPIYDIELLLHTKEDVAKLQKSGKKVICYFSAGSKEFGRKDTKDFQDKDVGSKLDYWDEYWVNISSPDIRTIMQKRICQAAQMGCDAIDPDNMDGYAAKDRGGRLKLTKQRSIDYVDWLSKEAGKYGMATGLKNAGEIIPKVLDKVQFSVNEECILGSMDDRDDPNWTGECEEFRPFIKKNKPVFNIEYPNYDDENNTPFDPDTIKKVCQTEGLAKDSDGFSKVLKPYNLLGYVTYCDGNSYTTKTKMNAKS